MTKHVLLLEDDLLTVSAIAKGLVELEEEITPNDIALTVYSTYKDVEELVNPYSLDKYDLILLDRDCKLTGSFHVLDIEKFGPKKIISISSTPQWNTEAKARGIDTVVLKTYEDINSFTNKLIKEIKIKLGV